jgi:nicotinamide/nicotinate riboside kinase
MIVGIGGVSRSGKTHLARQMRADWEAEGYLAKVLHQDDFVRPEAEIPKVRDRTDWECPESMDFDLFFEAIQQAQKNYDHVVAEGILVFYDPRINALFDDRLVMVIDRPTFLHRRARERRWGPEPVWYREYVWECFLRHGLVFGET